MHTYGQAHTHTHTYTRCACTRGRDSQLRRAVGESSTSRGIIAEREPRGHLMAHILGSRGRYSRFMGGPA